MSAAFLWPLLTVLAAALQIVRYAAQRTLTGVLGLWGATSVRFVYGLPFAAGWAGFVVAWRGLSGGPSAEHLAWATLGALCQMAATALLLAAMRDRAFAAANALQKTEVLGAAIIGLIVLGDALTSLQWTGMAGASVGVAMIALGADRKASPDVSYRAAACGLGAGLFFSVSSVSFRAGALAWGGDLWVGAAATLVTALAVQRLVGGVLLALLRPDALRGVFGAWKPSLTPSATGAIASACLFPAFALGPSAGAVKAVQLVDVLLAYVVSRRIFKERLTRCEVVGGGLALCGIVAVLL